MSTVAVARIKGRNARASIMADGRVIVSRVGYRRADSNSYRPTAASRARLARLAQ